MDFETKLKKPTRKLTDKQLKALAEGRRKAKVKKEEKIIKETKARQRAERLERERVLNEQKEIEIYNKLMEKGNKKIEEFKEIKYKYMEKASSIEEYNDLKEILDQITEEDILTGAHIDKLRQGEELFRVQPPTPEPESEDEEVEEKEEKEHHEKFIDNVLEKSGYTDGDNRDVRDI
jgi:hypothetical protein